MFTLVLPAQEPAPLGLVRGELLEWDAAGTSGELSIRTSGDQVFRFLFDPKTYVEREKQRIPVSKLRKGDALEIIADKAAGLNLRYARTVQVIERQPPPKLPVSLGRIRVYRSPTEHIAPRGNLTFAGVISRMTDERLVLRTRLEGEKIIFLRQDTRYLEDGSQVEASTLKPNTRVFVRAGKNLEDEIEAYQVVWGEILSPRGRP